MKKVSYSVIISTSRTFIFGKGDKMISKDQAIQKSKEEISVAAKEIINFIDAAINQSFVTGESLLISLDRNNPEVSEKLPQEIKDIRKPVYELAISIVVQEYSSKGWSVVRRPAGSFVLIFS